MWLPSSRYLFFPPKPQRSHLENRRKKESSNVMVNYRLFDVIERPPRNILKLRMGGGCSFQGFFN